MPTLRSHWAAFGFFLLYHLVFLVPLGRMTKVSINFMLCPSPSEWFGDYGHHYFLMEILNLGVVSYAIRMVTFCYCWVIFGLWRKVKGE